MTKKHYVWAAKRVAQAFLEGTIDTTIKELEIYQGFRDFFTEFGKNFDLNIFHNYILEEIKKR